MVGFLILAQREIMDKEKKNTVFVTGSAGFIGYHLSKLLLKSGWTVVGLDSLSDYYGVDVDPKRGKGKGDRKSQKPIAQITIEVGGKTQTIDENLFDLTPAALIRRVEEVANQLKKSVPPQTSEPKKPFG